MLGRERTENCPSDLTREHKLIFLTLSRADHDDIDPEEFDSEDEFMYQYQAVDTGRIEEVPAKEPVFNAVPLKSALKKKKNGGPSPNAPNSNPGTPVQEQPSGIGSSGSGAGSSSSNGRLGRQSELK